MSVPFQNVRLLIWVSTVFQQVKIGHKAGPAIFNSGKAFSSESTSRKIFQYWQYCSTVCAKTSHLWLRNLLVCLNEDTLFEATLWNKFSPGGRWDGKKKQTTNKNTIKTGKRGFLSQFTFLLLGGYLQCFFNTWQYVIKWSHPSTSHSLGVQVYISRGRGRVGGDSPNKCLF